VVADLGIIDPAAAQSELRVIEAAPAQVAPIVGPIIKLTRVLPFGGVPTQVIDA